MTARFEIIFAQVVREHLPAIERRHYSLIYQTIIEQLQHDPMTETINRNQRYMGIALRTKQSFPRAV